MPPQTPYLALTVTVDPLGRRGDPASDYLYYGLTFSGGIIGTAAQITPAHAAYVAPWRWSLGDVRLLQELPGGSFAPWNVQVERLDVHHTGALLPPTDPDYLALLRLIEARWAGLPRREERVRWEGPLAEESLDDSDAAPDRRPWAFELANYSSLPYPYAQWLNLSMHVRVRAPGSLPPRVVAAPAVLLRNLAPDAGAEMVLKALATSAGFGMVPGDGAAIEVVGPPRDEVVWTYVPGPGQPALPLPLAAHCGVARALPRNVGAVDGERFWIRPAGSGVYGLEWRAELPRAAADAFDIPPRIVDALTERLDEGESLWPDILASADLVIASLRDAISFGERRGPESAPALLEAWASISEPAVAAELRAILTAIPTLQAPNLAAWKDRLRRAVAAVDTGPAGATQEFVFLRTACTAGDFESPAGALGELSRLIGELRQGPVLAAILRESWQPVATLSAEAAARVLELADDPRTRTQLLLSTLTPFWDAWIDGIPQSGDPAQQRNALRTRFPAVLSRGMHFRFDVPPPAPLPDSAAADALHLRLPRAAATPELLARLVARVDTWAACEANRLIPEPERAVTSAQAPADLFAEATIRAEAARRAAAEGEPTLGPATRVPHPLAIEFGLLQRDTGTSNQADRDDPFRSFSGAVVLMRRRDPYAPDPEPCAGPPPASRDARQSSWRCLNIARAAQLTGMPEHSQFGATPWGAWPLIVPQRPSYRGGLSEASIVYDNRPLVALGPEALLGDHGLRPETMVDNEAPLLRYHYLAPDHVAPEGHAPEWAKQAGLVFGEVYEIAAFMMPNSGVLPPGVAESHARPGMLIRQPAAVNVPADVRRYVWYPRRVAVGQPRVSHVRQAALDQPLPLPVVPSNVFPRARELFLRDVLQTGTEGSLLLLDPHAAAGAAVPATFTFEVRRPSTDLQTWLRWQSRSLPEVQQAATVQAYYQTLQYNHTHEDTDARPLAIDDPAVAQLGAVLQVFVEERNEWEMVDTVQPWTPAQGDPGGLQVPDAPNARTHGRREPITVQSVHRTGGAHSFGKVNGGLTAQVREGRVYRLVVAGLVPEGEFSRFDPERAVGECTDPEICSRFSGYRVLSPWTLWVEVATPAWKIDGTDEDWAAIYGLLTPRFAATAGDPGYLMSEGTLTLSAELPVSSHPFVHHAELLRQRWVWTGRPVNPADIPLPSGNWDRAFLDPGLAQVQRWEASEFGDRTDADAAIHPMDTRLHNHSGDGPRATPVERLEWRLMLPFTGDRAASYHRFALQVYHRYAGLYAGRFPELAVAHPVTRPLDGFPWQWHSYVVPCRPAAQPAPPAVRLILPLTSTPDSGADTPSQRSSAGLLVIVRGAAFEHGGLAERFRVNTIESSAGTALYEFAPDPVRSGEALRLTSASAPGLAELDVQGPVGHSFDREGGPRLMVTSAFMIDPPSLPDARNAAYHFLKLRFGRSLDPQLTLPLPAAGVADRSGSVAEWTEGHWTQLLPNHRFVGSGDPAEDFGLRIKDDRVHTTLDGQARDPVPPAALHGAVPLLLVTQRVWTADSTAADPNSEAYVGLFRSLGGGEWRWLDNDALPTGSTAPLRGRILYVQGGSREDAAALQRDLARDAVSEATLWPRLFRVNYDPDNGQYPSVQEIRERLQIVGLSAAMGG